MTKDSDPSLPDGERISNDLDQRLRKGDLSRRTIEDDYYEVMESPELFKEYMHSWCQDFLDDFFGRVNVDDDTQEVAGLLLAELSRVKNDLPEPVFERAMTERATIQDILESFDPALALSNNLMKTNEADSGMLKLGTNATHVLRQRKRIVELAVEIDGTTKL